MAYNYKSEVEEQRSQEGNIRTGQLVLYERKTTTVALGESKVVSMPLEEAKTTTVALEAGKTTAIALDGSKTTTLPLESAKTTTVQLESAKTTTIALKNTARQIDILDMDQFGHNISKFRKNLSITDATQVNTDKEYGVMQIEDDFEFKSLDTAEAIRDYHGGPLEYRIANIKRSTSEETFAIMGSAYLDNAGDGESIIASQIINRLDDQIGNLVWLETPNGISLKRGLDDAAFAESASTDGLLDNNNVLTKTRLEYTHGSICTKLKITVNNNSSTAGDTIDVKISNWVNAGNGNIIGPFVYNLPQATISNSVQTIESLMGAYTTLVEVKFSRTDFTSQAYIPIFYHTSRDSGGNGINYQFVFNKESVVSGFPLFISSNGFLDQRLVQSAITLFVSDGTVSSTGTISLSESSIVEKQYVGVYALDGGGDGSNPNTILDYSYFDYFYGTWRANKNRITFNQLSIDSANNGFAIARIDNGTLFAYSISDVTRSLTVSYNKLIDVASNMSLGLISRVDNTVSLAIKIDNKFYTASGDQPYSTSGLTIDSVNIVERTAYGFAFTIIINSVRSYYSAKALLEYDGGSLLDYESSNQVFFCKIPLTNNLSTKIETSAAGVKAAFVSSFSVDNNIYIKTIDKSPISLGEATKLVTASTYGLQDSYIVLNDVIDYVVKGLQVPIMFGLNYLIDKSSVTATDSYGSIFGRYFLTVSNMPTLGEQALGYPYSTLPLRLKDEFPEISSNGQICDQSFTLGKTKFVSKDGNLYEAGSLSLVANKEKLYLSELGTIYFNSGYFLLAKDTDSTGAYGLTNVYTFTEFGLQLTLVIEDKIICNPVKTSVGIICCGRTGIWLIDKDQVRRLWKSTADITQASLKTDLDNSCVAVLDAGGKSIRTIWTSDHHAIMTSDHHNLGVVTQSFTVVTINQFGYVSSQLLTSEITNGNFIDIGATAELLLLDPIGASNINYLDKATSTTTTSYSIQSNQNSEFYQETVYAELVKIKLFAMGSGHIVLYINGSATASDTVELSSVTRYTEYQFNVNSTAMQMLDYKIVVDNGVKLLQRAIGIIIPKEEYYG